MCRHISIVSNRRASAEPTFAITAIPDISGKSILPVVQLRLEHSDVFEIGWLMDIFKPVMTGSSPFSLDLFVHYVRTGFSG